MPRFVHVERSRDISSHFPAASHKSNIGRFLDSACNDNYGTLKQTMAKRWRLLSRTDEEGTVLSREQAQRAIMAGEIRSATGRQQSHHCSWIRRLSSRGRPQSSLVAAD